MKFCLDEQETTINYDNRKKRLYVYTSIPSHIRQFMSNSLISNSDTEVLDEWEGQPTAIRFELDGSLININGIVKQKRMLSEEERHKRSELIKKAREVKKNTLAFKLN